MKYIEKISGALHLFNDLLRHMQFKAVLGDILQ